MRAESAFRIFFCGVNLFGVARAHPRFYSQACYVVPNDNLMTTTAVSNSACTLTIGGTVYQAGASVPYTPGGGAVSVAVNGPSNMKQMVGSTAGSWSNPTGNQISSCTNNGGGGYISNGYTSSTSGQWTPPATAPAANGGAITIGGTCGQFGTVYTTTVTMTAPPPPPTPPPPPPTTAAPTDAPTNNPTPAPTPCPAGTRFEVFQCVEIDACVNNPCSVTTPAQICTDIAGAPDTAAGRSCECPRGTVLPSCADVNACTDHPCQTTVGTTCVDRAAPAPNSASGRTCQCDPGFIANSTSSCAEVDACAVGPCVNRASNLPGGQIIDASRCHDDSPPSVSFTCSACPPGYSDSGSGDSTTCVDTDFCATGMAGQLDCSAQSRGCIDNPPGVTPNYTCATLPCEDQDGFADLGAGCSRCPDGSQPNNTRTGCIACPPGEAGTQGTCRPCPVGQEPNVGSTACVVCQPGFIRSNTVQASCWACTGTQFAPNSTGPCEDCTAPGFAHNSARSACIECPEPLIGVNGACVQCSRGLVRSSPSTCAVPATTTATTVTATTVTQIVSASNFCNMFMSTCGTTHGWASNESCQTDVIQYLTGTSGATSGPTLACRIYHLNVARAQPDGSAAEQLHCSHASNSGGGVCVGLPSASDFCSDFMSTCGTNSGWSSQGQCELAVPGLISGSYPDQVSSNTFGCRAYHLGVAKAGANVEAHCLHASPNGTDNSGGMPCAGIQVSTNDFCSDFMSSCGTGLGWSTAAACAAETAGFVYGTVGDTSSYNTRECRIYHLTVAKRQEAGSAGRTAHCTHAAPPGVTPVCEPMPSAADFCSTYRSFCNVTGAWSTQQGCIDGFSQIPRGFADDTSGNTQGCRVYHLGAALTNTVPGAAAHCTHASATGNNVCVAAPNAPPTPRVPLTTTAPPSTAPPTVVGETTTTTVADTVSLSSAGASGAVEREQYSKSSAAIVYVITFLVALVVYEYVLYISAIDDIVQADSSST